MSQNSGAFLYLPMKVSRYEMMLHPECQGLNCLVSQHMDRISITKLLGYYFILEHHTLSPKLASNTSLHLRQELHILNPKLASDIGLHFKLENHTLNVKLASDIG